MYAGVQFGSQCFCGNEIPALKAVRPESECNMKCKGDLAQKCGGRWRMNVYKTKTGKLLWNLKS